MSKFKSGDKVKIILYGHLYWIFKKEYGIYFKEGYASTKKPKHIYKETEDVYLIDLQPELVGQKAIVDKTSEGDTIYKLIGPNKVAWYNEEQLELI